MTTPNTFLPGDIFYVTENPRTIELIVAELVAATRANQVARRRVGDAERALEGEKNHLANTARYKANLELELSAAVAKEAAK